MAKARKARIEGYALIGSASDSKDDLAGTPVNLSLESFGQPKVIFLRIRGGTRDHPIGYWRVRVSWTLHHRGKTTRITHKIICQSKEEAEKLASEITQIRAKLREK